jgi:hypothetical protein
MQELPYVISDTIDKLSFANNNLALALPHQSLKGERAGNFEVISSHVTFTKMNELIYEF